MCGDTVSVLDALEMPGNSGDDMIHTCIVIAGCSLSRKRQRAALNLKSARSRKTFLLDEAVVSQILYKWIAKELEYVNTIPAAKQKRRHRLAPSL